MELNKLTNEYVEVIEDSQSTVMKKSDIEERKILIETELNKLNLILAIFNEA